MTADLAQPILVLGGTGKTGRRVARRLRARGHPVRVGSRTGLPPFAWEDPSTWSAVLRDVRAAYLPYPDMVTTDATRVTREFTECALQHGVTRLVLLTGRGEEEAQRAEREVRDAGADVTVLRCAWFMQIFSEDYLRDSLLAGTVRLPADETRLDPFLDADDIAEVAVAALSQPAPAARLLELTGPRLMSFPEAVADIAEACGRDIAYEVVSVADYVAGAVEDGVPAETAAFLGCLFTEVLGGNPEVADGVRRGLGRPPRDFADFAAGAAATGTWSPRVDR